MLLHHLQHSGEFVAPRPTHHPDDVAGEDGGGGDVADQVGLDWGGQGSGFVLLIGACRLGCWSSGLAAKVLVKKSQGEAALLFRMQIVGTVTFFRSKK